MSEQPKREARGRSRWPYVVLALGVCLVMAVGAMFVGGKLLMHRYEASVSKSVLLDPTARDGDAQSTSWRRNSGPLNVLLIGSDLRTETPEDGQRSDTIMIAQINPDRTSAYLVSVPRDLLVEIPEFAATEFGGSEEKINAAFYYGGGGEGGVQLLSATLSRLTGIKFDGAAVIDFGGFEKVIDLIGGVNMCVDTDVQSIHTGRMFSTGCHVFNGSEALDYSRQRYGLENGDLDRQKHNQQMIKAIFTQALANGIARNPIKLDQLIRALGNTLTVDTGGSSVADMMLALRELRPNALTGVTVPSYPEMIGETSFMMLDRDANSLFEAMDMDDISTWAQANPQWVNHL